MKLNYEVFYTDSNWWFRVVEIDHFGRVITPLYRRRYRTSEEANRCGRQALEHETQKRREYREALLAGQTVEA